MKGYHSIKQLQRMLIKVAFGFLLVASCTIEQGSTLTTSSTLVPATDLLLDIKVFADGWEANQCNSRRTCNENYALSSFYDPHKAGHVLQNVYRYNNEEGAKDKFKRYHEIELNKTPAPPDTRLWTLPTIAYHSPIANEYYVGCGIGNEVPHCLAMLRYHNYFIEFYFDIDDGDGEGLKIQEVEPILRAMDERTARLLNKPLPRR